MEDEENDIWDYQIKCKRYKKGNRQEEEAVRRRETGHGLQKNSKLTPNLKTQNATRKLKSKPNSKSCTNSKKKLNSDSVVHVKGSQLEANTRESREIENVAPKPVNIAVLHCSSEPDTPSQNHYDGFCPVCQMPFSVLVARVETPSWHVTECIEREPSTKECPYGTRCDNTIPHHYQEYNHQRLAQRRSDVSGRVPVIKIEDVDSSHLYPKSPADTTDVDSSHLYPKSPADTKDVNSSHLHPTSPADTKVVQASSGSITKLSPCIDQSHDADTLTDNDSEIICSPVDVLKMIDSAANISNDDDACSDSNIDDIESDGDSDNDILASLDCDEPRVTPDDYQVAGTNGYTSDIQIKEQQQSTSNKKMGKQDDLLFSQALDSDCDDVSLNSQETLTQSQMWAAVFTPKKAKLESQSLSSSKPSSSSKPLSSSKPSSSSKPLSSSQKSQSGKRSGSKRKKKIEEKSLSCRQSKSPRLKETKSQMSLTSFFKVESNKKSEACQSENQSDEFIDQVDVCDSDVDRYNLKTEEESGHVIQKQLVQSPGVKDKSQVNDTCQKYKYKLSDKAKKNLKSLLYSAKELSDELDSKSKCKPLESTTSVDVKLLGSVRTGGDAPPNSAGKVSDVPKESTSLLTKTRLKKSATDILMANRVNMTTAVNSRLQKSRTFEEKQTRPNLQDAEKEAGTNPVPGVSSSDHGWPTEKSAMKKRYCPFYKKIPGTGFTVDAFNFGEISGCSGYFLSHYHYDHYRGLTKKFSGKLFCSQITANLVLSLIKLKKELVHPLPMNSPCVIENVQVTFLEANHCPGAVLILFQLKSGSVYLHTGDFRADPSMETHPVLNSLKVHQLYLDTTYCNPTYDFPPQTEVIDFAVKLVLKELQSNSNTVIVCGSYTIGKEKIFIAISEALGCKICVARDKQRILCCLEDENLKDKLCLNYNESRLHVLPMSKLNLKSLKEHMSSLKTKYTGLIALEPTGWSYTNVKSLQEIKPKTNRNGIKIIGVPYSEHSSFLELKRFVQYLKPEKILPTVNNGNAQSRKKMDNIFKLWMAEFR